jgi:amino acid transporter
MYAGAPLSFGAFRRRLPHAERPWRLPLGGLISPLAFIVANFVILWTGWGTDWKLGIAILLGYALLVANNLLKLNPTEPMLDWRAAQWLPAYLVGLGVIVYLSDYGPLTDPVIPLWWDMVVMAVFSLVIYYWALHVALPSEKIEEMVSQVVLPEEGDLNPLPAH